VFCFRGYRYKGSLIGCQGEIAHIEINNLTIADLWFIFLSNDTKHGGYMARGDVAVTFTIAPDVEKLLVKMALKRGVSRKQIVTDAIKLLAAQEPSKGAKA
jgi:hypothetical protein